MRCEKIVSRLTISPLTKAFADACQPGSARGGNGKKNRLMLAIIDDTQDQLRPTRGPTSDRLRFRCILTPHQEKFRIGRQLVDRAVVANGRSDIEQIRLVLGVDGVKRN